jgi:hypothetical protein
MTPELRRVGAGRSPVVVVDGFCERLPAIVDLAAAMAPFPRITGNYYPGLRRVIHERDETAFAYVRETLRIAAPFIGGAFDMDAFDLIEASFSMITAPPATLLPAQRAPHFDSTDPDYIALLHYLSDTPGTGTAFYRQRATGIEVVDEANVASFVATAKRDAAARPPPISTEPTRISNRSRRSKACPTGSSSIAATCSIRGSFRLTCR